jgi:DNA-binding PadR family transcriptional regulator
MDLLRLRSTQRILGTVAAHDGEFSWYNIMIRVDHAGFERDPPPFAVLKWLVSEGYLRSEPPDNSSKSRYWLTEKGREFLTAESGR